MAIEYTVSFHRAGPPDTSVVIVAFAKSAYHHDVAVKANHAVRLVVLDSIPVAVFQASLELALQLQDGRVAMGSDILATTTSGHRHENTHEHENDGLHHGNLQGYHKRAEMPVYVPLK